MTRTHAIIAAGFLAGWLLGWYMQGFYVYKGFYDQGGNMMETLANDVNPKKK